MKKTFSINIAGFPFTIDEDAYTLLNDYLNTIENAFKRQPDSQEIVSDIESRVAELLSECSSSGSPIITVKDVEDVITRVGKPEEMIEIEEMGGIDGEETIITEGAVPPPYTGPVPPVKKKLYRDPQNVMLGGVCSGIAWYLNLDPTVVRLLTVLLTFLSATLAIWAYLVMWIVVPEARTPLERMQMMGEAPTMENIAKTVTGTFKEENGMATPPHYNTNSFSDGLATFFGVCAKALIIFGLIIALPILAALGIGLLGCIFALVMFATGMGSTLFGEELPVWYAEAGSIPVWGVLCGIGAILTFGIPLFILVRMGIKKSAAPLSRGVKTSLLILWIAGFLLAGISTGRLVNLSQEFDRNEFREEMMDHHRHNHGYDIMEMAEEQTELDGDSVAESKEVVSITEEGTVIRTDSIDMHISRKGK